MAVGFFVDDGEEHLNSPYQTSVITTVHSATQTPLQSPVSREYLVQAFCEALQRINIASKCFAQSFSCISHFAHKIFSDSVQIFFLKKWRKIKIISFKSILIQKISN